VIYKRYTVVFLCVTLKLFTPRYKTVDRIIALSPEDTWKILDDFDGIYRFHPLVERSPLKSEQKSGVGARFPGNVGRYAWQVGP
jgi:hypothetical protein